MVRSIGKAGDWLVYLPNAAGPPQLIARAFRYLEEMRTRVEAEGGRMWLSKNHDCITRVFEITEFRAAVGCVFCGGEFTARGRKYRPLYRGISIGNITFAGDIDLLTSMHTPEGCINMADMPAHVRAAARSDQVLGLCGAACFEPMDPMHGVTKIYSIASTSK